MTTQQPSRAIRDISSRRAFAPYFKHRWQNMQNIVNDSVFYSMVPEPYLSYYQAFIRQWIQWSQGYVPALHRGDFFSSGIGYTVCDIFARECMSGGYRIDSKSDVTRLFMEKWGENDLNSVFSEMFFWSNAGGNAILALTPIDGELYPSAMPINRALFRVGRHGEITHAVLLNRFTAGDKTYFARECRILMDGKPYYRVQLNQNGGTAVSPNWGEAGITRVPDDIEEQWRYAYGSILPGQWYQLPGSFKTLGLYNVRNKSVAVALFELPGYSDSTLHTALDVLYSIDYNYTQQQLDQYFGKTRVVVPKVMQPVAIGTGAQIKVGNGVSFVEAVESTPLEDEVYSEVPNPSSATGDPVKPFFMQPDLRGEAHRFIRDADLELLASKVGLSSSTLANHLTYNNSKTATEVNAEQDTTEISVNNKRALADRAINAMLKDVARFYGMEEDVSITWNRSGVNTNMENEQLLREYQAGVLPLEEFLKRRHRDLTDEEVESWKEKLNEQNSISFEEPGGTDDDAIRQRFD